MNMIEIDGAKGEGGGQILRSSLSLSLVTGKPFQMVKIRAGRSRPGLLRQHLVCVEAAAQISGASVEGAELGSSTLGFHPGPVRPGNYEFAIGSAGSTVLVLQTVLPALWSAAEPSRIGVIGGTHNPMAPTFEHFQAAFLPVLRALGIEVQAHLVRPGFFPAGGGEIRLEVAGSARLRPWACRERGPLLRRMATALIAHVPRSVAERELRQIQSGLELQPEELQISICDSAGPGNALVLALQYEFATEVVSAFGSKGKRAEDVADDLVNEARIWLESSAPIGEHLADQLLLPLALGKGGEFVAVRASEHLRTNAELIPLFLPADIRIETRGCGAQIRVLQS